MRARRVAAIVTVLLVPLCLTILWPAPDRPSIVIFVLDTTRADAVSAYRRVAGTTPNFDAIASQGLLYTHAYAQAPWTLPSHATLFTGLPPAEHGAGIRGWQLADAYDTLAERLRGYGYETAAFSENHFVSRLTNLDQGFETFRLNDSGKSDATLRAVHEWLVGRETGRPFFLFVNLMDAHSPYEVRTQNPYAPAGATVAGLRGITQSLAPEPLCHQPLSDEQLAVLRGLYLGDVQAADATLGAIWNLVRDATPQQLITVVTSDHGEHLGEHGLMGHLFGLWNELLHVPLVIHGLDGVPPQRIDTPVQLGDVFPTVMHWTGHAGELAMSGLPLPVDNDEASERFLTAQFVDFANMPDDGSVLSRRTKDLARKVRRGCGRADRVYGDMHSTIRYPLKLVHIDGEVTGLYDLAVDATENRDLAAVEPVRVVELLAVLTPARGAGPVAPVPAASHQVLSPQVAERLRALGYVE